MSTDSEYMHRALALAAKGLGCTSPNPMVGCVVVSGGEVVGEGYHEFSGGPHAEVNAFRDIPATLRRNLTVYVTLEPCAHHGKTPPCLEFLLKEDLARVVVAMEDPNPLTKGRSIARLREAGVSVEVGCCEAEARRLNEVFIKYITTGRPFVIAKCGMTLDGKIASHTGHSRWITCEASRTRVHEIRSQVDGILVGSRTVMLDDPSLTCRLVDGRSKDPARIILDAGEYLDRKRRIFQLNSEAPTWVAISADRDYPEADDVIRVPRGNGGVDMAILMDELGKRGITSLLIEGGGTTHASAFMAGIVDKVMFFLAPKILGGRDAVSPVEGPGFETVDEAIQLDRMTATPVGQDLLIEAYVRALIADKERCSVFTGIIEEIGKVVSLRGAELVLQSSLVVQDLEEGDSIAVNGACLTAVSFDKKSFRVQVSPETFEKTTLGQLKAGARVNLERAMTPTRRFGGHFVQGHVDGVGEVTGVDDQGDFQVWHFRAPRHVAQYLIPKGSVAVDGISLTVVNPVADVFSVAIIPATLEKTVLRDRKPGDAVNLEADMIGKHIFHFMQQGRKEPISMDFLKRHGFAQEA